MIHSESVRKEAPAISVISACHNHGRYVKEMVESVLGQTFSDFELIIVNDGSTDNTRETLDTIRDRRIRVIHTPNRGPSLARNLAIEEARGSIILNLDADDKIAPTFIEKALAVFMTHPEAGIVTSETRFFGARSGRFHLPPFSMETMLMNNVVVSACFFKKEDWRRAGGYSNEYPFGIEDYDFCLSLLELGVEVVRIPDELCFYRTYRLAGRCRSGRRKKSRNRMMTARLTLYDRHSALYARHPEARERMERLKKRWETEGAFTKALKEILHILTHLGREMIDGGI